MNHVKYNQSDSILSFKLQIIRKLNRVKHLLWVPKKIMVFILVKPWLIDLEKNFGSSTNAFLLAGNFICGS